MKRDVSRWRDVAVRVNHVRVPPVRHGPVEEIGHGTRVVAVDAPNWRLPTPKHVALMKWATMRHLIWFPSAKMKDDGVVLVGVGSVVWRFALPHWTFEFTEAITTVSNPEILVAIKSLYKTIIAHQQMVVFW